MPSAKKRLEDLLRSVAAGDADTAPALPANDDPVSRRVALYAELLRLAPPLTSGKAGRLLVSDGVGGVRVVPLGEISVEIGRGAGCGLRLDDPKVSRRNCHVGADRDGAWIEDLGSANGTFLNDLPVAERHRLRDGDVIRVGQVLLVFSRP